MFLERSFSFYFGTYMIMFSSGLINPICKNLCSFDVGIEGTSIVTTSYWSNNEKSCQPTSTNEEKFSCDSEVPSLLIWPFNMMSLVRTNHELSGYFFKQALHAQIWKCLHQNKKNRNKIKFHAYNLCVVGSLCICYSYLIARIKSAESKPYRREWLK